MYQGFNRVSRGVLKCTPKAIFIDLGLLFQNSRHSDSNPQVYFLQRLVLTNFHLQSIVELLIKGLLMVGPLKLAFGPLVPLRLPYY